MDENAGFVRLLPPALLCLAGVAAGAAAVSPAPAAGAAATALAAAAGVTWATGRVTRAVAAARADRRLAADALRDVDALLVGSIELRDLDEVAEAGSRISRIAAELVDARRARLYLRGPGRPLLAGSFGPGAGTDELGPAALTAVEDVLRDGALLPGPVLVCPVTGTAGVIGALVLERPRRPLDALTRGMIQLFGAQAGAVVDRVGAIDTLFDAATRDPVTGVANRVHASAVIASLKPGDGLLLIELEGLDVLRREGEEAANVVLGHAGLHLRNGIRPGDAVARLSESQFVVVLRQLKAPIERVTARLLDAWSAGSPRCPLSIGAALHLDCDVPLDTVDRAEGALASARRRGGGEAHISPVAARPTSSTAA